MNTSADADDSSMGEVLFRFTCLFPGKRQFRLTQCSATSGLSTVLFFGARTTDRVDRGWSKQRCGRYGMLMTRALRRRLALLFDSSISAQSLARCPAGAGGSGVSGSSVNCGHRSRA